MIPFHSNVSPSMAYYRPQRM